jgi:hypothetical protein
MTACWADPLSRKERAVLAAKLTRAALLLFAAGSVVRRQHEDHLARSLNNAGADLQDLHLDVTERAEVAAS